MEISSKGFTLVELLVSLAIIVTLAIIVLAVINPVEQLKKARDQANVSNATTFLSAIDRYSVTNEETPVILDSANSNVCSNIISAGAVYDFTSLRNEISDWFGNVITEPGAELYTGLGVGIETTVCYKVESFANVQRAVNDGCTISGFS